MPSGVSTGPFASRPARTVTEGDSKSPNPVEIETDLDLSIDGIPIGVESTGARLLISIPSLAAAVRIYRRIPWTASEIPAELLEAEQLTVEVRVRGRTVAVAGAEARTGQLEKALEMAHIELRLGGLLGAVGVESSLALDRVARMVR